MKTQKLRFPKLVQIGLLASMLFFSTAQAAQAKFWGWDNDYGGGFAISCGGGAYTVNYETYYIFGIAVDSREVWRNSDNEVIDGNPC